ncbi:MAG: hypothetical protein JWN73_5195 [Betaproteobacteria bacterium]|nr:hypothetical protein [Betaproteobacteria bacterium]
MNREKLQLLFDKLRDTTTFTYHYTGVLKDAAFELVEEDVFLAGIIHSLLEGHSIQTDDIAAIRKPTLVGTAWQMRDGSTVNLREDSHMLTHARLIEAAREECLKSLIQ